MHDYPEEVAKAAKWIWENKHRTPNWNWWVLSRQNPDDLGLKYPEVLALNVINILAAKGLLTPMVLGNGQKSLGEYALDLSDMSKWGEIQKLPTWFDKWVLRLLGLAGKQLWIFSLWVLSLAIAGALTHYMEILIDKLATKH